MKRVNPLKNWRWVWLVFLCLKISFSHAFENEIRPIDVVFDIDWTLVSPLADSYQGSEIRVFTVEGKRYRLADGVEEILNRLRSYPEVRISFFTGGMPSRTDKLLRRIILDSISGLTAYDIAHQKFSFHDLTDVSGGAKSVEKLKFSERYVKDLAIHFSDLDRTILLDDVSEFVPELQKQSLLWISPTYDFYESYVEVIRARETGLNAQWLPASEEEWLHERNRIGIYGTMIEMAILEDARANALGEASEPFVTRVQKWSEHPKSEIFQIYSRMVSEGKRSHCVNLLVGRQ